MIKKIIIIGGGNAGLAAAIGLKKQGFEVKLFEKAKCFLPLGGDIGLWPNGLKILAKLGIYDEIVRNSGRYHHITIGTETGDHLTTIPVQSYHQIAPYDPINISRYKLQNILVDALDKKHIGFDKKCIKIEETSDHVTAYFQDGTSEEADLLIGADGECSFVRKYVETDVKLHYAGYISLGGINIFPLTIKYNLIFGDCLSGSFPLGDDKQIYFFVCPHKDVDINLAYPSIASQFNLFRGRVKMIDEMLDNLEKSITITPQNYFFVKNYNLIPLSKWSTGRIVLIGDAAHLTGAILGCQTSVILQGTDTLVELLTQYKNDFTLALSLYEKIQRKRILKLNRLERKFSHKLMNKTLTKYTSYNDDMIACLKDSV